MPEYHDILQSFTVEELQTTASEKQALRACAELLLTVSEDFATATSLAMMLRANNQTGFTPSEDFLAAHPDNHPREYSGPTPYLALYLLYLAEKARGVKDILDGKDQCSHYTISGSGDQYQCDRCTDLAGLDIPIDGLRYRDVPPFHIGCRCKPLLRKLA